MVTKDREDIPINIDVHELKCDDNNNNEFNLL